MPRHRPAKWPPDPGTRCWVSLRNSRHPAPPGLVDHTELIFVALRSDKRATLRLPDGKGYALYRDQYDAPTEYEINGRWLPEGHPEVIAAMREWIERLKAHPGQRSPEEISEIISDLEWVIFRTQQAPKAD